MDADWVLLGMGVCFVFRLALDLHHLRWNPVDEGSRPAALGVAALWLILPVALAVWVAVECRRVPEVVADTWGFVLGWFVGFAGYWLIRTSVGFRKRR